ncbi:hypothetical protein [Alkaliphilus peptidifermentans]|uniref:Uncharacterized protein n=1 Tax=Alkaliphilus peptidifermentans DSM 18978 TaxID=1120976 RepID=A0A1G5KR63_9FIRM|nr:hypothetical protein [Alkaliphilus peptidifermentans]SCZ03095.1 hypothetical protein SAMN03080606_03706 [Alkaliphilus peptidifermentans DSM 18978]
MKGYLLLRDGSIFFGETVSKENIFGNMRIDEKGLIKVECPATGKFGIVGSTSLNENDSMMLSNTDFQILKLKIGNKALEGKIVADNLPIDFHVYDIKTYIPTI